MTSHREPDRPDLTPEEAQLHKHRLRTMLGIRALLTPEQRRELVRIHEEMKARRRSAGREGPAPSSP